MYRVIKIEKEKVYLGKNDGTYIEIEEKLFPFQPIIGDKVNCYYNDDAIIIEPVVKNSTSFISTKEETNTSKNIAGLLLLTVAIISLLAQCSN